MAIKRRNLQEVTIGSQTYYVKDQADEAFKELENEVDAVMMNSGYVTYYEQSREIESLKSRIASLENELKQVSAANDEIE